MLHSSKTKGECLTPIVHLLLLVPDRKSVRRKGSMHLRQVIKLLLVVRYLEDTPFKEMPISQKATENYLPLLFSQILGGCSPN
jgi:hypothetical protein